MLQRDSETPVPCLLRRYTTRSFFFFFSSRRRHTRSKRDWSSDVCSSDLVSFAASTRSRSTPPSSSKRSDRPTCGSGPDRKSTRLNSSHVSISYAVFCLKKKKKKKITSTLRNHIPISIKHNALPSRLLTSS